MVEGFCIPDKVLVVGIHSRGRIGPHYRPGNREFPGNQGSGYESGEEPSVGVGTLLIADFEVLGFWDLKNPKISKSRIQKFQFMLKNFFKIAWRNLLKNKTFSIINIAGLAIGLSCFLLITLYVVDELSYDRYNDKADRIYRVNSSLRFGGTDLRLAVCSDPMGATLKKDYPQVEEYLRFYNSSGSKLIRKGNEFINENNVVNADSTLFNVFTLPAIAGNTKTALNEPNTVVITESTAKKYFGSTKVIGKT